MKRRMLLTVIVVFVVLLGGLGYVLFSTKAEIAKPGQISDRSKEFMKQQKLADSSLWRNVVINKNADAINQEISLDKCFKLTVPFVIKNVTSDKECSGTIVLANGGNIAIGRRTVGYADLSDSPDVKLRMSKPTMYHEINGGGKPEQFLVFGSTESGYERTAFLLKDDSYLTVSLVNSTNENYDNEYFTLLKSIELL